MGSQRPAPVWRDVTGIVLLDKPAGLSSNQALQQVRRLFAARKAGHTGSLDPLATGMLPVCLGEATKVCGFLLGADKVYEVEACIGTRTSTADAEGEVIERSEPTVTRAELERAMLLLTGVVAQVPPMYSALKRGGRPLYALARAGQTVERAARPVQVHEFCLTCFDPQRPRFRVRCGKGTYIRTLIEDLAGAVGRVAHVTALRRLAVGGFEPARMVDLDTLRADAQAGWAALDRHLQPMDQPLTGWPAVQLDAGGATAVRRGQSVALGAPPADGWVRLYDEQGRLVGLGECRADGRVWPCRMLASGPVDVTPGCN
jgi:tRNA pseudouridine55 synthase